MNISFADFWGGFDYTNNIFIEILKLCNKPVNIIPFSSETDVLIYNNFGNSHHFANRSKVKKIFYTGENIRPNFNDCDYSLTFDFDTYDGKNIRFPLWLWYIDLFNKKTYTNPEYIIPLEFLFNYSTNPFFQKEKNNFCCIMNKHLNNRRNEIVNALSAKIPVEGYGDAFGRRIPDGEHNKLDLISNYKFHICFENSIYPGYYTEKLLHAKAAGNIPVYYSDTGIENDFNTDGVLNLYNFNTIEEFVEKILEINNNKSLYNDIKNQPIFKTSQIPTLKIETIRDFFLNKIL